eukprot:6189042-Pleurochrysis_carterae.AAC.2
MQSFCTAESEGSAFAKSWNIRSRELLITETLAEFENTAALTVAATSAIYDVSIEYGCQDQRPNARRLCTSFLADDYVEARCTVWLPVLSTQHRGWSFSLSARVLAGMSF